MPPPDPRDKRNVVANGFGDVEAWLRGAIDEAAGLMRAPVALIEAGPME